MSLEAVQPRPSLDFVESSVLEAVVPAVSNLDIEDAFHSWDGTTEDENGSTVPFLKQRHVLLFGTCCPARHAKPASYLYLGL
jgi:hypothetical protein